MKMEDMEGAPTHRIYIVGGRYNARIEEDCEGLDEGVQVKEHDDLFLPC